MQLLNKKTWKNEDIRKMLNLIRKWFIDGQHKENFNFFTIISYQEFKDNIYNFLLNIMNLYLEGSPYESDKCVFDIKILPRKYGGLFL